jgi:CSLREA domain-containing protein
VQGRRGWNKVSMVSALLIAVATLLPISNGSVAHNTTPIASAADSVAPVTPPRRVVVFVRGINSCMNDCVVPADTTAFAGNFIDKIVDECTAPTADNTFGLLKNRLIQDGFAHDSCKNFLNYSYTGSAFFRNGRFVPRAYSEDDTGQSIVTSVAQLNAELTFYQQNIGAGEKPQFILVGHSLGGVIALHYAEDVMKAREAGAGSQYPNVIGVMTIDSPVRGISPTDYGRYIDLSHLGTWHASQSVLMNKLALLISTSTAATDVVGRWNKQSEWGQLSRRLANNGILPYSTGNAYDCMWRPWECGIPGEKDPGGQWQLLKWESQETGIQVQRLPGSDGPDILPILPAATFACSSVAFTLWDGPLSDGTSKLGNSLDHGKCLANRHAAIIANSTENRNLDLSKWIKTFDRAVSIADASSSERNVGLQNLEFTITRTGAAAFPASVSYSVVAGSAVEGSDYISTGNGTVQFGAGETTKSILVSLVGDTQVEPDETFRVVLWGPVNAIIGRREAIGTIVNDDVSPVLTVNSTADANDGACTPGHCTLREAILAANLLQGVGRIQFNIPSTDPGCSTSTRVCTIRPLSALPAATAPVVVNGYSQPGTAENSLGNGDNAVLGIELNGSLAGSGADGLWIQGGNSTIKGLVVNGFAQDGIRLSVIGGNVVQGNFIGTNAAGTAAVPNGRDGVHSESLGNLTGGTTRAARNIISGNVRFGVCVSTNDIIQGNFIGTNRDGTSRIPNEHGTGNDYSGSNVTVGGIGGARNVVSGNRGWGVYLNSLSNSLIEGNFIGTDVTGSRSVGNGFQGILIPFQMGTRVGGESAASANIIAFNGYDGISLYTFDNIPIGQTRILGNSIHSNGGLGIELVGNWPASTGVTPNDLGDFDTGANGLQNYPVLGTASTSHVEGTLSSRATRSFSIEFFSSSGCDSTGFGEGEVFVGRTGVTTDSAGTAAFNFQFPNPVSSGRMITATATDGNGNTSEFAACIRVGGAASAASSEQATQSRTVQRAEGSPSITGSVPGPVPPRPQ